MDSYQKGHMAIQAGGLKKQIIITQMQEKKYKTKPKLTTN